MALSWLCAVHRLADQRPLRYPLSLAIPRPPPLSLSVGADRGVVVDVSDHRLDIQEHRNLRFGARV